MFKDRIDAGRQLASRILDRGGDYDLVLGVPRGGIPVAAAVSDALDLPLRAAVSNKIRAPWNRELAVGALGEDGSALCDQRFSSVGLAGEDFDAACREARAELHRRIALYGSIGDGARDQRVILVDDGAATGLTLRASVLSLRNRQAASLTVALPVASPDAAETLRGECDQVIVLMVPAGFMAVSQFYRSFPPVSDGQVLRLLGRDEDE
ncbi:MAG: phosphoribosyltransferase family protein [Bacillota bacterium]